MSILKALGIVIGSLSAVCLLVWVLARVEAGLDRPRRQLNFDQHGLSDAWLLAMLVNVGLAAALSWWSWWNLHWENAGRFTLIALPTITYSLYRFVLRLPKFCRRLWAPVRRWEENLSPEDRQLLIEQQTFPGVGTGMTGGY